MKITFEHKGNKIEWNLPNVNPSRRVDELKSIEVGCRPLDAGVLDCKDAADTLLLAFTEKVKMHNDHADPIRVIMAVLHLLEDGSWTEPADFQNILDKYK